jgi:hypothetical protein
MRSEAAAAVATSRSGEDGTGVETYPGGRRIAFRIPFQK